ncbi:2-oxo-tetronate isomerase [Robbsia sp. KACC 23696]|uniref:2-oxo-tetronate isomerase n=1 Tax=Robbsia sp. KACC 23696 TaxID=3149231 RepID=UPI00325ADE1C
MLRFAANLSFLYPDLDFLDRFAAAERDGFAAVEYLFPYAYEASVLTDRLQRCHLQQALFNAPPGDWAAGERGIAALAGREDAFKAGIDLALRYAEALGNRVIHVMAGIVPDAAPGASAAARDIYLENLAYAAALAGVEGRVILIEPINTRDVPGYFLNYQADALAVCRDVGSPHLKVQMDLYHAQIMEGDLAMRLRGMADAIGHIQIAGVPDRHEPDRGEVDYDYLFSVIEALGYGGWIGCEYRPVGDTSRGLDWLRTLRAAGRADGPAQTDALAVQVASALGGLGV